MNVSAKVTICNTNAKAQVCVYRTADSEHCFDLSGLISTVGVAYQCNGPTHTCAFAIVLQIVTLALTFTVFSGLHA